MNELQREIEARQADIERYLAEIDPAILPDDRRSSVDSAATAKSDEFAFDFPSPDWSAAGGVDIPEFDVYYDGYGYASDDEEERNELDRFPIPAAHLPHIRVTSH